MPLNKKGDDGTRTHDQAFAEPCLANLATSPEEKRGYDIVTTSSQSGRSGSNRQPFPWQGNVLPIELRPRFVC